MISKETRQRLERETLTRVGTKMLNDDGTWTDVTQQQRRMTMTPATSSRRPLHDPRIKAFFDNGHFFGHYDSRGGATLIVGEGIFEALNTYAESFFPEDELREHIRRMAVEEHMGSYPVYFFDESPEDGTDLDEEFDGPFKVGVFLPAHARGWVDEQFDRIKKDDPECEPRLEGFPDWVILAVVFWAADKKAPEWGDYVFAPVSLGEDACGVVFYDKS